MAGEDSARLDKWLFCARIFRTRSLASQAIAGGRVKLNGQTAKAGKTVKTGDEIVLKRDGRTLLYEVLVVLDRRVGSKALDGVYRYEEEPGMPTDLKEMLKLQRDLDRQNRTKGKPSKKDRRQLEKMKFGFEE